MLSSSAVCLLLPTKLDYVNVVCLQSILIFLPFFFIPDLLTCFLEEAMEHRQPTNSFSTFGNAQSHNQNYISEQPFAATGTDILIMCLFSEYIEVAEERKVWFSISVYASVDSMVVLLSIPFDIAYESPNLLPCYVEI